MKKLIKTKTNLKTKNYENKHKTTNLRTKEIH